MTKITALIITLNEEKHIGACIDSLAGVADEIIVIDSFSTDRTKDIAVAKGAKVIEKNFAGFGAQKNLGAELATHDYILSIDADEVLSDLLRQSIINLKITLSTGIYRVNRLNHIGAKPVRSCGWYPDTRIRLYNRKTAYWDSRNVHEKLISAEHICDLEGDLLHYSFEDLADMKRRGDRYAKLGAAEQRKKSSVINGLKMLTNPIAKFIKTYVLQGGLADGYAGLMISYYKARETFFKYYLALR